MNNYHFPKTSAFEEVKGEQRINQTSPSASFITERKRHQQMITFLCSMLFELPGACRKRSVDLL